MTIEQRTRAFFTVASKPLTPECTGICDGLACDQERVECYTDSVILTSYGVRGHVPTIRVMEN